MTGVPEGEEMREKWQKYKNNVKASQNLKGRKKSETLSRKLRLKKMLGSLIMKVKYPFKTISVLIREKITKNYKCPS